jgi:hypothetical protein
MAKEITLEDLANSVTPNTKAETKASPTTTEENVTPTPKHNDNIKAGGVVDPHTLGAHLRDVNHLPDPNHIETVDAPLVKSAFEAMDRTLAEKKKFMDENVVPVIMKNAEEMATARELGQDVFNEKMPDREEDSDENIPETVNYPVNNDYDPIDEEDEEVEQAPVINYQPVEEKTDRTTATVNEPTTTTVTKMEPVEVEEDDLDALMKDLDSADKELSSTSDDEEESFEEVRERFKESLDTVKVARDPIDFSKFKISKNVISSAAILAGAGTPVTVKTADWALYHTGRSMTFSECRGPELDALYKNIRNANGVNSVILPLRFIHEHVVDANKPSFEAWCKLIRTEDLESLYFGMYKACYGDANLLARACSGKDGCKKSSLIDTDINKMVKFADDETEKKFKAILNRDTTTESTSVTSTMLQISDDFAISYSVPTLYSTFVQYATLKEEITNKYSDTLNTMAYIDGFFKINHETMSLDPIAIKEYPNNLNKTVISRLKVYNSILKTLSSDQYNILMAKLSNISDDTKITYVYPEAVCPECGATIPEEEIDSMIGLLFTRARLVQIKSL